MSIISMSIKYRDPRKREHDVFQDLQVVSCGRSREKIWSYDFPPDLRLLPYVRKVSSVATKAETYMIFHHYDQESIAVANLDSLTAAYQ